MIILVIIYRFKFRSYDFYKPVKLITSMRTSDSLTDDESYFYSELKRLKFIVDQIKTDTYFIVLDEILKAQIVKTRLLVLSILLKN